MVSQSPYKVYTVLEGTAWQQAVLLLCRIKKEVVDVYNKEKTMMAAVN